MVDPQVEESHPAFGACPRGMIVKIVMKAAVGALVRRENQAMGGPELREIMDLSPHPLRVPPDHDHLPLPARRVEKRADSS